MLDRNGWSSTGAYPLTTRRALTWHESSVISTARNSRSRKRQLPQRVRSRPKAQARPVLPQLGRPQSGNQHRLPVLNRLLRKLINSRRCQSISNRTGEFADGLCLSFALTPPTSSYTLAAVLAASCPWGVIANES